MGTRSHILHGDVLTTEQTVYTFTLNSFRITDTRSQHNDTDFVSIAVTVGSNPAITLPAKSMGDVNNGTHAVNLSIADVEIPAGQVVAFSYSIVNSGHDKDSVSQALQKLVSAASSKAVAAGAGAVGTGVGGPIGAGLAIIGTQAGGWAMGKLESILFANCDGTVAAGDHVFNAAQLAQQTAGGKVASFTDENKGTDSNWGCGGNSHYFVTWSISARQKAVLTARSTA
jgi:hypothetical protein